MIHFWWLDIFFGVGDVLVWCFVFAPSLDVVVEREGAGPAALQGGYPPAPSSCQATFSILSF